MDKREAEFYTKLLATFKIEAEEHLKNVSNGLLDLEKGNLSNAKEIIETIFREAHNLKGAARAVNFNAVEKICQALENVLSAWKKERISISPTLFDHCYATLDLIDKLIQDPNSQDSIQQSDLFIDLLNKLKDLETGGSIPSVSLNLLKNEESLVLAYSEASQSQSIHEEVLLNQDKFKEKIIHISATKLDKLLQQVEEMLIVKLTATQRLNEFRSIQQFLSQWEKEWSKIQTNISINMTPISLQTTKEDLPFNQDLSLLLDWQQNFLKIFKDQFNKLTRSSIQYHRVITGLVDGLLDDTKKFLMQPLSSLLETFPRMVRDISHALGKEVQLEIKGEKIEIDRRILDELKDPLIHLIRNSIDHGIEKPEERLRNNKAKTGTITIEASQATGNHVEILVKDDGQGIPTHKIKQLALKQGLITEKELSKLSENDILKFIFKSDISTSSTVTELSGRGLGLGIVSEKVNKLGGEITVETKPFTGTIFRLTLPLSLATFRGIHIQVSNHDFIIPTQNVKKIFRYSPTEIKTVEGEQIINYEGCSFSFAPLADVLGLPATTLSNQDNLLILLIKVGDTTVAFGIDYVLNEKEILIKGLGRQLARIHNISAATIVEWGKIIPILDPFDLIKNLTKRPKLNLTQPIEPQSQPSESKTTKSILIAEDSMTARVLLKNILESAGYQVKTAIDGAEAFAFLEKEPFDLLLSDIEMPHLNGFELTEKVRQLEKTANLPVVLCTSRSLKEDHEHGIAVGANAYIDKSSFTHTNLLNIIQQLL